MLTGINGTAAVLLTVVFGLVGAGCGLVQYRLLRAVAGAITSGGAAPAGKMLLFIFAPIPLLVAAILTVGVPALIAAAAAATLTMIALAFANSLRKRK